MMDEQRTSVPTVSVLMTLYNKGAYVEEAVRSVLGSNFTDLELLVVDDASTDDGPARVRAIGDPRVRLLASVVNQGRPAAANRGLDAARGRFVAVLDADDRMHPDRLQLQVDLLQQRPEVGVCGGWLRMFGAQEGVLRFPAEDAEARALAPFAMPVSYGACMLRRSVLEQHALRCPEEWLTPGMDYLFMLGVGRHTRYANLQQVVTDYRVGQQNMRHGRDANRDAPLLMAAMFRLLDMAVGPDEVALHLYLCDPPYPPLGLKGLMALRRWQRRLLRDFGERAPGPWFEREVERRWDRLFHSLVRTEPASALLHVALSGTWRQRLGYWAHFARRHGSGRPVEGPVDIP